MRNPSHTAKKSLVAVAVAVDIAVDIDVDVTVTARSRQAWTRREANARVVHRGRNTVL
jgi:hypothetical protein